MSGSVVLVGNAPDPADRAALVDGASHVVRFNDAFGFGSSTGRRLDDLFLVNCGGQMREWLNDPGFERRPQVAAARRIMLPLAPGDRPPEPTDDPFADHLNHADEAVRRLSSADREVRIVPRADYESTCAALGIAPDGDRAPSTGFLALQHYRRTMPQRRIELVGFGFAGWDGHAWDAERRWVEERLNPERLVWHR